MKKNNCFFFIIFFSFSINPFIFHEFGSNQLLKQVRKTESEVYAGLKKLCQQNWNVPINYLVVPWHTAITQRKLKRYMNIRLKGGFTVCMHIHFEKIIPLLKKMGIDTLFTPHVQKDKEYIIMVLPFPHHTPYNIKPAQNKDILYSFIGNSKKKIRKKFFSLPIPKDCVVIERSGYHFDGKKGGRGKERDEYIDVLSRSRFSICLRGTGPSTIRFWESLQAGAIPVLVADDMVLPDGVDWKKCIVRVKESDINLIDSIVRVITYEQENEMRNNCVKVFEQFSGDNFISVILKHYRLQDSVSEEDH